MIIYVGHKNHPWSTGYETKNGGGKSYRGLSWMRKIV